jgi:drug/metabolite transporter (DMT)-like permease
MESLAIGLAGIGHACWDYQLAWMAAKDPDASILHMHWLRMFFMMIFLWIFSWRQKIDPKPWLWWLKFALVGWVIPSIIYTMSVIWTGYRISVSFQPFIPLVVLARRGTEISELKYLALTLTMGGTLAIWYSVEWHAELWQIWGAVLGSSLQVVATAEFFVMLKDSKNKLATIRMGNTWAVILMFFATIVWTPQHLSAITNNRLDIWILILVASAIAAGIKYGLIAYFSQKLSADGVAIFECVHPIATLFSDIIRGKDIFEWDDAVAVTFLTIGWILYPKK